MNITITTADIHSKYMKKLLISPKNALIPGSLLFFSILLNWTLLDPKWLPYHDCTVRYQVFHFFYSTFYASGELATWAPYGTYGLPAGLYQVQNLSPMAYIVGLAGVLFNISNTLVLFKISLILDVYFFIFGVYLFSKSVLKTKIALIFVLAASFLSTSNCMASQPYWNLYAFSGIAYVLFFLNRFLSSKYTYNILLAGIFEILCLNGNIVYIAPIHLLIICIFTVSYLIITSNKLKYARFSYDKILILATVFIVIVALYYINLKYSMFGTVNLAEGRDPATNKVTLDSFLQYSFMDPAIHLHGLFFGAFLSHENNYYFGLLFLFFLAYGCWKVTRPAFWGLLFAGLALVWLGFGGMFARLTYHFPGMDLFRHISLLYATAKLLFILAAGFGFDHFFLDLRRGETSIPAKDRKAFKFVIVVILFMTIDLLTSGRMDSLHITLFLKYGGIKFGIRLLAYFIASLTVLWIIKNSHKMTARSLSTTICALLFIPFIVDMGIYQRDANRFRPTMNISDYGNAFDVSPLTFKMNRFSSSTESFRVDTAKASNKWEILVERKKPQPYKMLHYVTYLFLDLDPCCPMLRTELFTKNVVEMILARGGRPSQFPTGDFLPQNDPCFLESLGCGAPKIRLVDDVIVAHDHDQARTLFRNLADPSKTLVLELEDGPVSPVADGPAHPATGEDLGEIRMLEFSPNRKFMDVNVRSEQPVWLFIADAYHRDWRARVNGQAQTLARANLGFTAVRLLPGRSKVLLEFGQGPLGWMGLFWAFAGLGLGVFVLLWGFFLPGTGNQLPVPAASSER